MKTLKVAKNQPEKAAEWIERLISWNPGFMDADDEVIFVQEYAEEDWDDVQGNWQDFLRLLKGSTAMEIYDVTYAHRHSEIPRRKQAYQYQDFLILNLEYQYFQARVIIEAL